VTRKLLLLPALAAAGAATIAIAPAESATSVKIGDNYFVRPSGVPTVTVSKGAKVTWRWTGRSLHNVHVTKGPVKFASSSKTSGTFSKTVRRRGTYTIICTIHTGADQKMKLVVK
jgi:plastocyanin